MARNSTVAAAVKPAENRLIREVARRRDLSVSAWARRVLVRAAVDEAHELADPEDPDAQEATG